MPPGLIRPHRTKNRHSKYSTATCKTKESLLWLMTQMPPTLSHENPTQQAQFNEATPRSLGNDARSGGHLSGDSLSSRERGSDKPGFMTGAYSRVGNRASGSAQNANYTYDDIASQSPYGEDTRPANAATNLAAKTPTDTPAETTAIDSINKTSANSYGNDHNKIQSGLRGSANTGHNEPYWGDIPFGAGVYNGVTGHGSNEPVAHQRSLYDQYDTAPKSGIYNGVTGHGSKRSTSPGSSKYDEGTTSDDLSHRQRAFPLANNGSTTTATTKPNDADEHKRNSRFTEGLAGAGATAAGGYAAHEHSNRDHDRRERAMDEKLTGENSNKLGQSKPDALSQPRNPKGDEVVNKYEGKEQALPHRPFVAAPTQNYTQEKTLDRRHLGTENENKHQKKEDYDFAKYGAVAAFAGAGAYGADKYANRDSTKQHSSVPENSVSQSTGREPIRSDAQPLNTKTDNQYKQKEESNLGKYGAAAAAAGAGAYGADKYVHRNSTKQHSSVPETEASQGAAREPIRSSAQPLDTKTDNHNKQKEDSNLGKYGAATAAAGAGAYGANKYANRDSTKEQSSLPETAASQTTAHSSTRGDAQPAGDNSRAQPHYNSLLDGTPSGIASTGVHRPENSSRSGASQSERYSVPSEGDTAAETQSTARSSTDSSHGGKYNVLASGTPSGINLEQVRAEKQHRREQQQPASTFLSNAPPSSLPSQTSAAGTREPAAAVLGNSAGYPAKQAVNERPEQLSSARNDISTGAAFSPTRNVTHRCTKCGEENDISQYFKS
ncbi:hypothetical protein CHU98_g7558 [Xylaria longipes]|nr:hypothetical protein CHU98_g7558 [Xylaria longipes]